MRKKVTLALSVLVCLTCAVGLTACGQTPAEPTHTHSYQWVDNGDGTHKQHCSVDGCDAPDIDTEPHVWGTDDKCEKCPAVKPNDGDNPPPAHSHSWSTSWQSDDTYHWHNCTADGCDVTDNAPKDGYAAHDFSNGNCICGKPAPLHAHSWSTSWASNDTHHWHNCTADGCDVTDNAQKDGYAAHDFTNGDCICGKPAPHAHVWSTSWQNDETHHWHNCTAADCDVTDNAQKDGYAAHDFSNGNCICGRERMTQGLAFTLDSDNTSYSVTGIGTATDTDIYIASTYQGKPVTSIGSSAFSDCRNLTGITIPDSVTRIDQKAFYNCNSLISIIIPDSVKTFANEVFYGCNHLLAIYCETAEKPSAWDADWNKQNSYSSYCPVIWNCKTNDKDENGYTYARINEIWYSLKDNVATVIVQPLNLSGNITIPVSVQYKNISYSVTSIGDTAFNGCRLLKNVTIPDSITSFGYNAFAYCSALTSITIPNCVASIGRYAFRDCPSLTIYCETVEKPSNWDSDWNYSYCPVIWNCKTNNKTETGYEYAVIDGIRYSLKDDSATITRQPSNLSGNIIIPATVTYKNISYPVTSIAGNAFTNCRIRGITIPDSVTSIGNNALTGCTIETATIPATAIPSVPKSHLKAVVVTSGTSIAEGAFSGCGELESITLPFVGGSATTGTTYRYPLGYIFGTSNYTGGTNAYQHYYGSSATAMTYTTYYIPASLKSVTVTGGSIPHGAFSGCRNITSIILPDSVTWLGAYTFENCTSLTDITISNNITSIASDVFLNCSALTIYCEATRRPDGWAGDWDRSDKQTSSHCPVVWNCKTNDKDIDGYAYTVIDGIRYALKNNVASLIRQPSNIVTANIPDTVTYNDTTFSVKVIQSFAFKDCDSLTQVTLPVSLTSIWTQVFQNCRALNNITFTGTKAQWNAINKNSDWFDDHTNYTVHCTDGDIAKS